MNTSLTTIVEYRCNDDDTSRILTVEYFAPNKCFRFVLHITNAGVTFKAETRIPADKMSLLIENILTDNMSSYIKMYHCETNLLYVCRDKIRIKDAMTYIVCQNNSTHLEDMWLGISVPPDVAPLLAKKLQHLLDGII